MLLGSLKGTQKQYASYIMRWITYCRSKQIGCHSATLSQALDYLVEYLTMELDIVDSTLHDQPYPES